MESLHLAACSMQHASSIKHQARITIYAQALTAPARCTSDIRDTLGQDKLERTPQRPPEARLQIRRLDLLPLPSPKRPSGQRRRGFLWTGVISQYSLNCLARISPAEQIPTSQGRAGSLGCSFFLSLVTEAVSPGLHSRGPDQQRCQENPRLANVPKILRCFSFQINAILWLAQDTDSHPCCCSHAAESRNRAPAEDSRVC